MFTLLFVAILSVTLSLVLTPLVSYFCTYCGVVDHPNGRKHHISPVPRAGGVAIMLSYLLACAILLAVNAKGRGTWAAHDNIFQLLPAAVLVFFIGLIDDLYGIKAIPKLLVEIAAAICAFQAGVHLTVFGGHALGPWLSLPATVLWLVLCANALNLMDGLDGLACGIGLFATGTALLAACVQHNFSLALAVIPLFGALLGFLRYNFNPARIFLGDSGSLFVGFLLGGFGILWTQKSATLLGMTAPLMVFAIPLLDTLLSVVRRFLHNKPIFSADRGHIHHRLLARGLTPRKVVVLLYACCGVGALCSVAVVNSHTSEAALIVFGVLVWVGVNRLKYTEFRIAADFFRPRNFSPVIAAQMRLTTLQQDLAAATTTEACWLAVRSASADLGFSKLCMKIDGKFFEDCLAPEARQQNTCTIRIPLSSTEFINIGHDISCPTPPMIMTSLASILYTGLEQNACVRGSSTRDMATPGVAFFETAL